jgi:5-formyltetrahydrofolate cyclo-ligase
MMMEHMAGDNRKSSLRKDIDENLKRVYEDALKEEIPDRFKELLAQLKAKEGKN